MFKENSPLLSDDALDALTEEINQQFGWHMKEQIVEPINDEY